MKVNPLYAEGACRIGCIGCPMAGKGRYAQFARNPKYKENYIKAFDRMIKRRVETGMKPVWENGESCMRWWMEDKNLDGQINMFDTEAL
jgi:phosphoadenosine phosphosulfate reductase